MNFKPPYFPGNTLFPLSDQMGHYMQDAPIASVVLNGQLLPPEINRPWMPCDHNVIFQPSANCPRKFIIVDQTCHSRQVMFNPNMDTNLVYPGFVCNPSSSRENIDQRDDAIDEENAVSSFKEDSDDIDALLSAECEENQERNDEGDDDDDDVVSTARTGTSYKCDSPGSCSNYDTKPLSKKSFLRKPVGDRCNENKRRRIRKMVKSLKGIVPGANHHMSAVSVLDEAVRYLKSLRVEVQKFGVGKC